MLEKGREDEEARQTSDSDSSEHGIEHGFEDDLEKASTHASKTQQPNPVMKLPTAQDWSGPDDPENPLNWSLGRRAYQTSMIALLAFARYVLHRSTAYLN